MMNGSRESDNPIVSEKPSNKVCDNKQAAEKVERREVGQGEPIHAKRGLDIAPEKPWIVSWRGYGRLQEKSLRFITRVRNSVLGCRISGMPTATHCFKGLGNCQNTITQ
jgi:hypothetical protein